MRCRDVEAFWDEVRGECPSPQGRPSTFTCVPVPTCQELYEQFEGVAYCLSCLPKPEPSCDLAKKVVEHIAQLKIREGTIADRPRPSRSTPIGRLYVGFKESRIAYIGIDTGEALEDVAHASKAPAAAGSLPARRRHGSHATLEQFFSTWRVDDALVDISDLTPFEQAALRAAAQIPPGEVRSYAWVATQIGRPSAARAVGQVMARNPLALFFPVPPRRRLERRTPQLLLRARDEGATSQDGRLHSAQAVT